MKYVTSKRLPELMAALARGEVFSLRIFGKPGEIVRIRTNYDDKYPKSENPANPIR